MIKLNMAEKNKNPLEEIQRKLANALYQEGDPLFYLLDMQRPMLVHLKEGTSIAMYYAGFNQTTLKAGCSKFHYPVWKNKENTKRVSERIDFPLEDVSFTEGLEAEELFPCQQPERAANLINNYLQKRRIVEVTLKGTEKGRKSLVGFIGEAEGDYFDLAHSVNSNGEYDTWFRPSFIPEKYLLKPNDLLRLEEISSIAILRKFTPEPGFSDKGILDFP